MAKQQKLFAGAGILALAGLIAKILSAVYRVPFQNIVGNQGFYVFQQVYPIYGIGMVMALSGWPLFISKMVAEQPTQAEKRLVARRLFWLLAGISIAIFALIYFGASVIAAGMQDMRLVPEIKAVAWMFLLMPCLATSRGYTQGQFDMVPTALSQVIEQVVRVTVILGVAWFGMQHAWDVYRIGTWATFAATIAGVATALYLLRSLWDFNPLQRKTTISAENLNYRQLWQRLWREGGLLAVLAALLVFLQLIDSFTVKGFLVQGGLMSTVAESTKGVYDRGQPLVQLGMVVATGLGTSLLPTLHTHWQNKAEAALKQAFQMTVRMSLVFSALTTFGLIAIMPVVNMFLFSSREGDGALMWYVTIIIPATLITVLTSVLQSMNRTRGLVWFVGISLGTKYVGNVLLVPAWGIDGAGIATLIALLPLLTFAIWRIPRSLWHGMLTWQWWCHLGIVLGAMVITAVAVRWGGDWLFGQTRGASILTCGLAGLSGAVVAIYGVIHQHIFNQTELCALPKGEHLAQLSKGN
ncbi:polysaccharide biosynthesis protein [Weissella viridescens]|uniref:Polysaccharide biosynthesis protein n=1 Tax=Weissella viridescens TaxID=1629 RepID=A0A3P2RJ47_WEIVI|nr:polysaccharide biosynthesis protein [Weissella viridescens]RRG17458.1 polysaccharide biosynthesis protein [Weissella viridescens]